MPPPPSIGSINSVIRVGIHLHTSRMWRGGRKVMLIWLFMWDMCLLAGIDMWSVEMEFSQCGLILKLMYFVCMGTEVGFVGI